MIYSSFSLTRKQNKLLQLCYKNPTATTIIFDFVKLESSYSSFKGNLETSLNLH
ncbi:hypothetical protein HMPREF1534_02767 [Phocaeicola massiliensis B84634 = Timone 84634 = DSM 17679 = JCM 13223]|uniref:Uncharacterized protein n=1 Tax=Phocaeicola massiliensis B84634 = Timone 84634 = DSM 17679 = JCM 13223 TaxID=1121098 RepID=U6RD29_9BACT|nr:hypothetical protein HMPREF1534_02767 [Phocaeicola massiliensis B84634 = Timone 84634 = DSM 17679 = JCM 13223]